MLSGAPIDTAIGVLQVTVHSARGIKASKIGGGAPDPYISLSLNQRAELARTKHKDSTYVFRNMFSMYCALILFVMSASRSHPLIYLKLNISSSLITE